METNNKIASDIVAWIKRYAEKAGLETLVVGVSGGVDSALVSTLCGLTGLDTIVLNLPINSKPENTELSSLQCMWLMEKFPNVCAELMDMTYAYDAFENTLNLHSFSDSLASANSKSRMRMMALYYVAASHKGLVVGTGNKVEDFGVGFFTKYGDGGVDISPIADLTKTQVRELAGDLGIATQILEAPPTDGLWEDSRTDEEQIGASYEELEWAMNYMSLGWVRPLTRRQQQVLEIYMSFHLRNKHKMRSIPVFKLSQRNN
jgi:NAD+ synthase|tara:strand:- start:1444 stop:2226 length:783 start_codon:yes stop_codon:yes gene_type:complete